MIGLSRHPHHTISQVNIRPARKGHLLFAKSSHQIELKVDPFFSVTSRKELCQLVIFVAFRFLLHVLWPISLLRESSDALRLEERQQVFEPIMAGAVREFLVAQTLHILQ